MTREEAIKMLEYIRRTGNGENEYKNDAQAIAIEMVIEALGQEPCEDAISQKIDEFELNGKTAEIWIVKGKLQIRCLGVIHNIPLSSVIPQPCGDAVRRKAVINTLDNMDKALDTERTVENYKKLLMECYKDLPPVTPKEKIGWIPVSERLPEESKRYVVATKYNDVMTDFYTGESFLQGDDIIAWMPLPEPYKAESEDKE